MPNGKPGDHWYTDVTIHRLAVFSPAVDELIREVDAVASTTDAAIEPWQRPIRRRVEHIVESHLELASRSDTVVPERHLRPDELEALEADVRAYRESLS